MEICQPKAGETLVVSGAGGSVGSHVGQIGKIKGLKVIGIAGSDKKCNWLVEELGFDHAINYKTQDLAGTLKKIAPNGVDCYFDTVCDFSLNNRQYLILIHVYLNVSFSRLVVTFPVL